MNDRQLLNATVDYSTSRDLEAWDGEGGAPGAPVQTSDAAPAAARAVHRRLLECLGAAVVCEWKRLPMPLQRTLYNRAVGGETARPQSAHKRRMARFLHVHGSRGQEGRRS